MSATQNGILLLAAVAAADKDLATRWELAHERVERD